MDLKNKPSLRKLYFKDTSFAELMNKRIYNVLLFASHYDAFMLEEDGRIDEQVFNEYHALNLRYPPRFNLASTIDEAVASMTSFDNDLIIIMPNSDTSAPFDNAKFIKERYPDKPIIALTPFANDINEQITPEDMQYIDNIFCWRGNPDLLLAIIKMMEDQMNVEDDVKSVGVQTIIMVEDRVDYYSYFLPLIYHFIFTQSQSFMTEALNSHERMLRMRGRPKVLMAKTYDEAIKLYDQYAKHTLGVITDVSYPMNGNVEHPMAGPMLCKYIRSKDWYMPIIIQSSESKNKHFADEYHTSFINKTSKKLGDEMSSLFRKEFGFGDCVFIDPETNEEVIRVRNLRELQKKINEVPSDSLLYHASRNDISRWLYSRAMFPLGEFLKNISMSELADIDQAREIIFNAIINYRRVKNKGVIAAFDTDHFDIYSNFARIGQGSLGGKARGLAFMNVMLKRYNYQFEKYHNTVITIPRTVVISTEIFDEFMCTNNLFDTALSTELEDSEILNQFLAGTFQAHFIEKIKTFLTTVTGPIAVRSSSLMEDSHYHPFAGTYSTYMVPIQEKEEDTVNQLLQAVKAVFASCFYQESKNYMSATNSMIEEEKMGIVLQEVVGQQYDHYFYPSFSGVGRSINFYPVGFEKPEDGVVHIAMGLGKHIVDGGRALRFAPTYPHKVLQTSTLKLALNDTQSHFAALDLNNINQMEVKDDFNIVNLPISTADKHKSLQYVASTLDFRSQMITDNVFNKGRRVITFNNILKHGVMPLADICKDILRLGQNDIGCPVEIEFAVKLSYDPKVPHEFFLLQIRPISATHKSVDKANLDNFTDDMCVLKSNAVLGNGRKNNLHDIIYIKTDAFDNARTGEICEEVAQLNKEFEKRKEKYILIGPGRWGSSDPWLGIPVSWPQISQARAIVECGLENFRIEPSQGSHFFQNITSFHVCYFTVNPCINDGLFDETYLNSLPAEYESKFIRHVHIEEPARILINGMTSEGVILKPGVQTDNLDINLEEDIKQNIDD